MLSSALIKKLEFEGVSSEAIRKRLTRLKAPVYKLRGFFTDNQSFFYHQKQIDTHEYYEHLVYAFSVAAQRYYVIIKSMVYHHGYIKQNELRWKRMWHTLLDYNNGDEVLAKKLSNEYLSILPTKKSIFPYAKEILDYLVDKKYTMYLITNGFETTQRLKLQYSGIAHYFQQLITSEKSYSMKPHREIFDVALQLAGARVEDSIMIGDAVDIDIAGALNAGWHCAYYNPLGTPHNYQPTYEVSGLDGLIGIF